MFNNSKGLSYGDFTYTYEGEDLVNATPAEKNLYVVATPNKAGYTGKIKASFRIAKRELNDNELEVKLNKNTVSYAEKGSISSDYVSVKDTVTGETLPTSVYSFTATGLGEVGTESALTIQTNLLSKDTKTNNNYRGTVYKSTTDKVKVVANQMSDFKIVVDSIGKDATSSEIENAIHFYLGDKDVTNNIKSVISFKAAALASGATTLSVAVNGDNKNVIGNTTVTLPVTLNKITAEGLTYKCGNTDNLTANTTLTAETYTGTAITKDIKDVRFVIKDSANKETKVNLSTDDYKIEYVNDNTNAKAVSNKTVEVYIVGTGNYSGRVKLGTFTINAAVITADDITVPAKVQYDGGLQTVADYMTGKVTVKAGATGKKKEVPAAAYKLTAKAKDGRGVYTFCMCPGGYVVNASSEENRLAVNGMSYSGRNGKNANSAVIVTVSPEDFPEKGILGGLAFQRQLEEAAFAEGQGKIPVQLFGDFKKNVPSSSAGAIAPQMKGAYSWGNVRSIFPEFIARCLEEGITEFGKKIPGYDRDDAVLSGVESRTSSPVRIA